MAGETLRSWLVPRGGSWASWGSATSLAFAPGRLGPWSTSVFTQRATWRKTPYLVGHPGELQLLVLVEAQMKGANVMKTIFGNVVSFPTMRAGVLPRRRHGRSTASRSSWGRFPPTSQIHPDPALPWSLHCSKDEDFAAPSSCRSARPPLPSTRAPGALGRTACGRPC